MKTLAHQELSVGDLCFEINFNYRQFYLCVIVRTTRKMVKIHRGSKSSLGNTSSIKPKFLIKVNEQLAEEYVNSCKERQDDYLEFNVRNSLNETVMNIYNEMKKQKNG